VKKETITYSLERTGPSGSTVGTRTVTAQSFRWFNNNWCIKLDWTDLNHGSTIFLYIYKKLFNAYLINWTIMLSYEARTNSYSVCPRVGHTFRFAVVCTLQKCWIWIWGMRRVKKVWINLLFLWDGRRHDEEFNLQEDFVQILFIFALFCF
jgi:phage shock protein PspC (stress-responsive transcriptional regulator)